MKTINIILALLILTVCACGPSVDEIIQEQNKEMKNIEDTVKYGVSDRFALKDVPCGVILGGNYPYLTVKTDGGELLRIAVPKWVWDEVTKGDKTGDCSGAAPAE